MPPQGEKFLWIQKNRTILRTWELDIHQNCRFEAMEKRRRIKFWQIQKSAKTCSEYWGGRERDNWTGIWQGEKNVRMGVINRQLLFLWKWNDQHVTSVGQRKKLSPRQDYSFLFFSNGKTSCFRIYLVSQRSVKKKFSSWQLSRTQFIFQSLQHK